ncbi:MAG: hypothetical protein NT016_00875 [Candidatus Aenigmarchaeota archaeon]|nr:hypothetical protein [Candidatus Aenigmarchaeota archaeon]
MEPTKYTRDRILEELRGLGPKVSNRNLPSGMFYRIRKEFGTFNNAKMAAGIGCNPNYNSDEHRSKIRERMHAIKSYLERTPATFGDIESALFGSGDVSYQTVHNMIARDDSICHLGKMPNHVYYLDLPGQRERALRALRDKEIAGLKTDIDRMDNISSLLRETGPIALSELRERSGITKTPFNELIDFMHDEGSFFSVQYSPDASALTKKPTPTGSRKDLFLAFAPGQEPEAAKILLEHNGVAKRYSIAIPNIPRLFKGYPEKILEEMKSYHMSLRLKD